MKTDTRILVLNAGSSSLKFAVFAGGSPPRRIAAGAVDRIGRGEGELEWKLAGDDAVRRRRVAAGDHAACLAPLWEELAAARDGGAGVDAVAHRIVQGGPRFFEPQHVTPELLAELRRLSPFDPQHLPAELTLIEAVARRDPRLRQLACFDTAFHRDLPAVAQMLPLPRRYHAAGVRRYGFHGLSYEFLLGELRRLGDPAADRGRVILAHLGSGASLAAVRDGRCVDTTMGFTPAGGLVMGTRAGDLDPGLAEYLEVAEGMSARRFGRMINRESGLLGLSETSADVRELLAREPEDPRAAEALAVFCYQATKWIGAFVAALGGLDTLVFAGGVGEHCAPVRARICRGLAFLGLALDEARNPAHDALISSAGSRVAVRVIRTDEEIVIARHALRLLTRGDTAAA